MLILALTIMHKGSEALGQRLEFYLSLSRTIRLALPSMLSHDNIAHEELWPNGP